jgi:hypothetical protein
MARVMNTEIPTVSFSFIGNKSLRSAFVRFPTSVNKISAGKGVEE